LRGVGHLKFKKVWYYLVVAICIFFICLDTTIAQSNGSINFTFEHQDPAGDVLVFNATLNGTTIDAPEFEALDFKWVYSEEDSLGNVVLKIDLKSKNKFIDEDETKYVFRIITTPDNKTGYNITYQNQTMVLMPFSAKGNGTAINYIDNYSFTRDKGDEMMVVTVSISKYLSKISYYRLDAYSMKVTDNATYLDYISELPGHPEYVNQEVQEAENLDTDDTDDPKDSDEDGGSSLLILGIAIVVIIIVIIMVLLWISKKKNRKPGE
jgi:hypothetical protein